MKILIFALLASLSCAFAADDDAAYTKAITERADKIVATIGVEDATLATRVRDMIAQQYRDLSVIHDARDTQIKAAKELSDKVAASAATEAAKVEATNKLSKLHAEFLSKLFKDLSSTQVDKIKDGMTYGVVQVTYNVYLKMYPELTDAQKQQIMAWLVEAREIAMDQGTSNEKHAVFGKYKGRINNYLSKAGYDAKKGEENFKKTSQPPAATNN